MKLKNKLATLAISAPMVALSTVATATALTSCSCADELLNLTVTEQLKEGEKAHYKSYKIISGAAKTNESFVIEFSFEAGWKLSSVATKITAGNALLKCGTNDDYEIVNNQIVVHANKIKSTEVSIYIYSEATYLSFDYEFKDVSTQGKLYEGILCAVPGNKITTDSLIIKGIKGDKTVSEIPFGTAEGQAHLYYNNNDITESFVKDGFTVTEDMIKTDTKTQKKEITQIMLRFSCLIDGKGSGETITAFAGYKPESIAIVKPSVEKFVVGGKYQFDATGKDGAWNFVKFEFGDDGSKEFADLEEDGYLTCKKAGTVYIAAVTMYDEKVYDLVEITIEAA